MSGKVLHQMSRSDHLTGHAARASPLNWLQKSVCNLSGTYACRACRNMRVGMSTKHASLLRQILPIVWCPFRQRLSEHDCGCLCRIDGTGSIKQRHCLRSQPGNRHQSPALHQVQADAWQCLANCFAICRISANSCNRLCRHKVVHFKT